jgi:hypothetical protein
MVDGNVRKTTNQTPKIGLLTISYRKNQKKWGGVIRHLSYCVGVGDMELVIFPMSPIVVLVMFAPAVIFPPVSLPVMFCAVTELMLIPITARRETTAAKVATIDRICFCANQP